MKFGNIFNFGKKVEKTSLELKGGHRSTNIQANNVSINGLSYEDAKNIALDVFKSNFIEMSQNAAEIANLRAEKLVNNFLSQLKEKDPYLIAKVEDPDMQYTIYTAQKEYARSGDLEQEEILVNILLERIQTDSLSLRKIALNEALEVLPKVTNQQLDIMTLIFLLQDTQRNGITNNGIMENYLKSSFLPFMKSLTVDKYCYKHLQFTGCCSSVGLAEDQISKVFIDRYPSIFNKGFELESFKALIPDDSAIGKMLVKCLNNSKLYQFKFMTKEQLAEETKKMYSDEYLITQLQTLFDASKMNINEANGHLINLLPEMKDLIYTWENSYMCAMDVTTVGTTLAIMNLKRKANSNLDLSVWIK